MALLRFLLFAGDKYDAEGGWDDFYGSYATADEAGAAGLALVDGTSCALEWFHVVDSDAGVHVPVPGAREPGFRASQGG